jgi:hypothetical protein
MDQSTTDDTPGHTGDPAAGTPAPTPRAGPPSVPRRRGVFVWVRRAALAGVVATVVIHFGLALLASAWTVRFDAADAGGTSEDLVEFAVMTEAELASLEDSALSVEAPDAPVESESELSDLTLFDEAASALLDQIATDPVEMSVDVGAGDLSTETADGIDGSGAGSLGGASFFGLTAEGTRFAYLVDVSSSMRDDGKIQTTQRELSRSVEGLAENGEFLIVLYSDSANPLGGSRSYRDATDRNKASARRQIADIYPSGGTQPLPGFELIFNQRTKPDAIYFMTDGRFDTAVAGEVARMNRRFRIPVHTILFGQPSSSAVIRDQVRELMEQIARQSGGSFVHHGVPGGGP